MSKVFGFNFAESAEPITLTGRYDEEQELWIADEAPVAVGSGPQSIATYHSTSFPSIPVNSWNDMTTTYDGDTQYFND